LTTTWTRDENDRLPAADAARVEILAAYREAGVSRVMTLLKATATSDGDARGVRGGRSRLRGGAGVARRGGRPGTKDLALDHRLER
jgi:hypothetical protein